MEQKKISSRSSTERKQLGKGNVLTKTIKCKLVTVLHKDQPQGTQNITALLHQVILAFARLTHEATIFSNGVLHYCLENGGVLPTFNQTFFHRCMTAVMKLSSPDPLINDFLCDGHWTPSKFPYQSQLKGFSQMFAPIARELFTNATNSIWINLFKRQKQALRIQGLQKQDLYQAIKRINSKLDNAELKQLTSVEKMHRQELNPDNININEKWAKQHTADIIPYLKFLLEIQCAARQEREQVFSQGISTAQELAKLPKIKTFTLLPIRSYQRHSLPIQTDGLHALYRKLKMTKLTRTAFGNQQDLEWQRMFNLDALHCQGWIFQHCITTDGVQVSVTFWKPKLLPSSYPPPPPKSNFAHLRHKLIIGIDPGRNTLITAFHSRDKTYFEYSKKEHHHHCKYRLKRKKREYWLRESQRNNPSLKAGIKALVTTFKCASLAEWQYAWCTRVDHEDALWAFYGAPRFRNQRFETYHRKQQVYTKLHRRFKTWLKEEKTSNVVLAYGNGKFPVAMKGQAAGPLTEMYQEFQRRQYSVVKVDEFRTSKLCSGCFCQMEHPKVKNFSEAKPVSTHHILRCSNPNIVCGKRYVNRDRNAAENMYRMFSYQVMGVDKPSQFQRVTQ